MEKFKLKILNPRSSELRRLFGSSLKFLFNIQDSIPNNSSQCYKKQSLINRLKVSTKFNTKENSDEELSPVEKLPKVYNSSFFPGSDKNKRNSWLKPRDQTLQNYPKRFWNSLEIPTIIKERKQETPDLWSSFTSTPISKQSLEPISQCENSASSESFYSLNSSVSSYYSVNSIYSINTGQFSVNSSVCNTPLREVEVIQMNCDEDLQTSTGKRRIFRAKRNK